MALISKTTNINNTTNTLAPELRPCWVKGKRALFHRWADSARPATPRGVDEEENEPKHQVWSVHGIIEFEDGTVERVWPYNIQFADGGNFDSYEWGEQNAEYENTGAVIIERASTE